MLNNLIICKWPEFKHISKSVHPYSSSPKTLVRARFSWQDSFTVYFLSCISLKNTQATHYYVRLNGCDRLDVSPRFNAMLTLDEHFPPFCILACQAVWFCLAIMPFFILGMQNQDLKQKVFFFLLQNGQERVETESQAPKFHFT